MSGAPNRRPSLVAVSPAVSGRRLSSGLTPNVATPVVDSGEARRGSLRDLPNERDTFSAALRAFDRDIKSGKLAHCTYPSIRERLLSTPVSDIPRTIPPGVTIKTLDGTYDPVHAFDELISDNLEAIPITLPQHHIHNLDGTITIQSTHPIFQYLYKLHKEKESKASVDTAAPESPALSAQTPAQPISPKPLSLSTSLPHSSSFSSASKLHEQCFIIDPATNTTTLSTTQAPHHNTSSNTNLPPSAPSPRDQQALRDSLHLPSAPASSGTCIPHATCPNDCQYRQAVGWLDIRDLASCIVYVYQQPVNEDFLEFKENGQVVDQPFQVITRGLDGITDLPSLSSAASFGSLSDSGPGTPTSAGAPVTSPLSEFELLGDLQHSTSASNIGIVYEDDEAKSQGQILKQQQQQASRLQGYSHRLSLAPMAEECDEDNFDMSALQTVANTLNKHDTMSNASSASPSSGTRSIHSEVDIAQQPTAEQRSRSQSRHRRRMMTTDELSSDFTSGGTQAWLNTLKHGLGKFSTMGNISTAYLSRRHPVRTVKNNASLYDICKILSMPHTHRVAITDANTHKIVDIVSHRTIIKYLYENREELFKLNAKQPEDESVMEETDDAADEAITTPKKTISKSLLTKQIDDLNIGTPGLTQVRDDILGLDALQEMDEHNRTGLAVVDDCGRLVGATSARTIKRITKNRDHKTMSQPLINFIQDPDETLVPDAADDEKCMVSHGAVVLLDEDVTFLDILEAMYKHNTNRIFLVDDQSYPTKVISFVDVMQLLLY